MRYADYSYYTDNYLSGRTALISASDFDYYAEQAGIWLSHYTYGNIENVKYIPDKVKQCTCAIAEKMCRYDKTTETQEITSEKVGDYSVSYESCATRKEALKTDIKELVNMYLSNTGLLSRVMSGGCTHEI